MPLLNFLRNLLEIYEFIMIICLSYAFIKNTSNKNIVKHILRLFGLEESLDVNKKFLQNIISCGFGPHP